jgi:subtilisin family serine protease
MTSHRTLLAVGALLATSILLAAPALSSSVNAPQIDPRQDHRIAAADDRFIVAFHELPADHARYNGLPVVEAIEGLDMLVVRTKDPEALRALAARDANVRYVEWDNPRYATLSHVPDDARYNEAGHWGSKRIGAEAAWDVTFGSSAVKIAVVDSGLNKDHQEFAGQSRILQGYDFRGNNNNPQDTAACDYHGTHVTGTLGATINNGLGIAGLSQSSILPLKIFAPTLVVLGIGIGCTTTTTAIVNALKHAGDEGAHVSQNSWGGGSASAAINDAIAYAHERGTIHVAAAGNSGSCSNCVSQPWRSNPDKVLIISSSTSSDAFSSFSSQGPEVTFIAPGSSILSSTSGTSGYSSYSGTSMAAPHVSGTVGLVLAENPTWGFSTVKARLAATAEDLGMIPDRQGFGLVRADLAVAP